MKTTAALFIFILLGNCYAYVIYGDPVQNTTLYVGLPANWSAITIVADENQTIKCNYTKLHLGYFALDILNSTNESVNSSGIPQRGANDSALVGWWWLDNETTDHSGNGNDGTNYGATYISGPVINGSYSFDGIDDNIDLGNPTSLQPTTGLTVAAWVNRQNDGSGQYQGIVATAKKTAGANRGQNGYLLVYQSTDSRMYFYIDSGGNGNWRSVVSDAVVPLNEWHYWVATWDGTNMRLYRDGVQQASTDTANTITYLESYSAIGQYWDSSTNRYFGGLIDEVRIYNRSLSAEEIVAIYNNESGQGGGGITNGSTWAAWNCGNDNYTLIWNTTAPEQAGWVWVWPAYISQLINPSMANYTNIYWTIQPPPNTFTLAANPYPQLNANTTTNLTAYKIYTGGNAGNTIITVRPPATTRDDKNLFVVFIVLFGVIFMFFMHILRAKQ